MPDKLRAVWSILRGKPTAYKLHVWLRGGYWYITAQGADICLIETDFHTEDTSRRVEWMRQLVAGGALTTPTPNKEKS